MTMIRLLLVIRNKNCKGILYLYAFGYRPYRNDKKILKIKQMAAVWKLSFDSRTFFQI